MRGAPGEIRTEREASAVSQIRVGIIGTGFGTMIQAPGFAAHPAYDLVALSGVHRPGRAAEQAAKLGIPHAYDDWRAMLQEENLDLVSVVSAPNLHAPMTIAALERGIHVLCEKPTAMNLAEVQAMIDAAERRGLVGMIDHEFRHLSTRTKFKDLVKEGFLGRPLQVNVTWFYGGWERHQTRPMNWLWREETGGGMLGAFGSHMIDTARWLFGEFTAVSGWLGNVLTEREGERVTADDNFAFLAQLAGGGIASFSSLPSAHHGPGFRIEAYGTNGTIVMTEDTVMAGRPGEPLQSVEVPKPFVVEGATYPEGASGQLHAFVILADNLAHAIRGTTPQNPSPETASFRDGAAVQVVLDAVRRSHREQIWVKL